LDRLPDTTLALLAEGYRWGARLCRAQGADVARTRLLLRPTVVVRGAENARRFYGDGMVRAGAAPRRLQRTLFGVGGVQGLDGEEHHDRKAMFLGLLGPERDVVARWRQPESLIDAGAAVGPRYLRGVRDRRRLERWLAELVRQVRTGRRQVPESAVVRDTCSRPGWRQSSCSTCCA
jgi:fatty-acid peroxygenase